MSNPWGLPEHKPVTSDSQATSHADGADNAQPPAPQARGAVKEGHRSMVRLHVAAIAVWLVVAAAVGGLWLTGRDVPGVLVPAGLIAAAGHALFLTAHLYLASAMRSSRRSTSHGASHGTGAEANGPRPTAGGTVRRESR